MKDLLGGWHRGFSRCTFLSLKGPAIEVKNTQNSLKPHSFSMRGLLRVSGLWLALLCGLNGAVWAANISITPTRVILSPEQKSASLSFINRGDKPLTLQIFLKSWQQDEVGRSLTEDSRELVVFPKMLTVEPGQQRPIRLGFQGQWPTVERSFRIFADELPNLDIETGALGVVFPVRLSIPVFVREKAQAQEPQMQLKMADIQAGQLRVQISNQGTQHIAVEQIQAELLDAKGRSVGTLEEAGGRVLAQHAVFFELSISPDLCQQVRSAQIQAKAQSVTQSQTFTLSVRDCKTE